jgi:hypothetical protein
MALTIGETIQQLHSALRDYIEATYHISHPTLVEQRRRLLDEVGVIHQRPYIESTPRYKTGAPFRDLGLRPAILEIFSAVSTRSGDLDVLVHDPPYEHQAAAVEKALVQGRSLVVMTATGSGKTEAFLLPILGKLALEASSKAENFGKVSAVRAIVLYPMNALVNDQLGRLRLLFGDPRVADKFVTWAGRPARFARYTSRTLYPGVRTAQKDQERLAPLEKYYVRNLELANGTSSPEQEAAKKLVTQLQKRGKWPAKPDLPAWYGSRGSRWRDPRTGKFMRCVTQPDDPELITRHEVQQAPPDILVTNYSMLEYMLMRPLERPIFDRTRDWLQMNPDESLLLVLDEAHLYRGAAGAEVALLMRRLRTRLGIPPERLQVICTSASFENPEYATEFGAQLTGKDRRDFDAIEGNYLLRDGASSGTLNDAHALVSVDLEGFYLAESEDARLAKLNEFLEYRGVKSSEALQHSLHEALVGFPPMGLLINLTMQQAQSVETLGAMIFEGVDQALADRAVTTLMALGSLARRDPSEPGLLPCRVHSFYRGLAGLWVCMDSQCSEIPAAHRGGPAGKLYSQPREACGCGARVLELYTCRNCGSAYARAYTNSIDEPDFLWSEPGGAFRILTGMLDELEPLDLLLESPITERERVQPAEYDLVTGRLNPHTLGPRNRQVFLRNDRSSGTDADAEERNAKPGEFRPCGVCGESASFGRSSVQDHQTKGDQPFQALITKQIQVQPPSPVERTKFAPLRGRKVLVFSDSRQTAARLAPNLQTYSTQDALRPLIVAGFGRLLQAPALTRYLSLEDLYLAVLVAAKDLEVRLRPELRPGESFQVASEVEKALDEGVLSDDTKLLDLLMRVRAARPPESLLGDITTALSDRYYGLESLALASIVERPVHSAKIEGLPEVQGIATTAEQKLALARTWLRAWHPAGFWLSGMPATWWLTEVHGRSGQFLKVQRLLRDKTARQVFDRQWVPQLLGWFTDLMAPNRYKLRGIDLALLITGDWAYCQSCRTAQRPFPGTRICVNCGQNTAEVIDPNRDPVFAARKGYYRASTVDALKEPPISPMALIAAEHTAQLNTAQVDEVFSKAEEYELRWTPKFRQVAKRESRS